MNGRKANPGGGERRISGHFSIESRGDLLGGVASERPTGLEARCEGPVRRLRGEAEALACLIGQHSLDGAAAIRESDQPRQVRVQRDLIVQASCQRRGVLAPE